MGAMGKFIRDVGVAERDRIIGAMSWFQPESPCEGTDADVCLVSAVFANTPSLVTASVLLPDTADAYDRACERFGTARVVRAIKARAARLNGSSPEQVRAILEQPQSRVTQSV